MRKLLVLLCGGALLFGAGVLVGQRTVAGEKSLIHAISFKPVEGATPEQIQEVWAATRRMAAEVPGIRRIWTGKVTNRGDALTHGIVMEFENAKALEAYGPHPGHKKWEDIYFKVRTPGSNTIDVVGE